MAKNYNFESIKRITTAVGNGEKLTAEDRIILCSAIDNSICKNHTGKMENLWSVSTSVMLNEQCRKNAQNKDFICSHCYAISLLKMRHSLEDKLSINHQLYTSCVLPVDCLPQLNCLYFRFESFGDLNNETQVINYFNICRKNKHVKFALWSKNPQFIEQAINEGHKKPKNLVIVYSSPILNIKADAIMKKYSFIDKVFTVYDSKTIKEQDITINCGGNACFSCLRCYASREKIINEKLK